VGQGLPGQIEIILSEAEEPAAKQGELTSS
jgi:hypothetical protein